MITIGTDTKPYQEGMISNALKSTANIDTDKIVDDWSKANDIEGKVKIINNDILTPVGDKVQEIDGKIKKSPHRVNSRSIIARARNSVLQFPVYVVQSLRVNEAQIISKLFERVYTTLVQTAIAQHPYISEEEANDLVFLKNFHTNIKEATDAFVDKYYGQYFEAIDDVDKMIQESVFLTQKLTENCTLEFCIHPADEHIITENTRLINEPLAGLFYLREAYTDTTEKDRNSTTQKNLVVSAKDLEEMAANREGISKDDFELARKSASEIEKEYNMEYPDADPVTKQNDIKNLMADREDARRELEDAVDKLKQDIKANKINGMMYHEGQYLRREKTTTIANEKETKKNDKKEPDPVNRAIDSPVIMKEADIKKINGLLPYTIEATFRIKGQNGAIDRDIHYIIGIKTVLHLIRTQDLADDLRELVTGNIKSLQKVRYKTGEISFMDYIFNQKQIKADAAKRIDSNKRWLNTLKRLGEYEKMNGSLLKKPIQMITNGNVPIPNGTLILTQPDVTALTNQTGIDLSVVSNSKRLAKSLFLIAVVIVDSSAGTMRVLFPDSDNDWDVQSLASIDAELAKTDNSQIMRELNRMVNK